MHNSDGIKDTEHSLLLCPSFDIQQKYLLAGIVELLRPVVQIADLSNDALIQLLLYGDHDFSNDLNRSILELTLRSSSKLVGLIEIFAALVPRAI